MTNLDKLLKGVEVEWLKLGEVTFQTKNIRWKENEKTYRYIDLTSVNRENNSIIETAEINASNAPSRAQKIVLENDIIFATTRPTQQRMYLINEAYSGAIASTGYCVLRANVKVVLPKWIFFYLTTTDFKIYVEENQSGSAYPAISDAKVKDYEIPIPPLKVQKEIVRILDTFTNLTTELTIELTKELIARKKQYNYYREQLFSFKEGKVEWKTLGELGEVRMCKRILKEQTTDIGDIPFYKIGTFGKEPNAYITKKTFEEYKSKYNYPKIGEVLISASGTIGRTVIFDGVDSYFQDSNIVWIENDEKQVLNKYLFHFYQIAKWDIADGGTIQRLYNDNLKKIKIPIPNPNNIQKSLKEQERIVSILNKFEIITSSISEGLPKEIELRKQQYEYYRDRLLTFQGIKN
jgi:type I restriction enzyme, S subunit